jgi:hypothetical protein
MEKRKETMGMDVCGKNPTTEEGEYFVNNAWMWHPLADYVAAVAPDIAARCEYWHTNDGDGLDAEDSLALADRLQAEIDVGRTARYERLYRSRQEAAPKVPCWLCEGTGTRRRAGDPKHGGIRCNACGGNGVVDDWVTFYPFSVENVRRFVAFLRGSGGFEVW